MSQFFNWFVAVSSVVGNLASVLGFLTILATVIGYIITHTFKDPFGDTYRRPPRYDKFFVSIAERVRKHDKLFRPGDIRGDNVCTFRTTTKGMAYQIQFADDNRFLVLLTLSGRESRARYLHLVQHKVTLQKRLGLTRRFLRKPMPGDLMWDPSEIGPDVLQSYSVILQFPELIAIEDDARTLKRARSWAIKEILTLKQVADSIVTKPLPNLVLQDKTAEREVAPV